MRRYRSFDFEDMLEWLTVLGIVAIIVIAVVAGVKDCNQKNKCRDNGGHVEKYNCHTVFIPMSCGEKCTTIVPQEECDWRCVGANAEDGR